MTDEALDAQSSAATKEPPRLRRHRREIAEVENLRHSEMQSISDRLERLGDFPWARMWVTIATLTGGAAIGGGVALIPFLSADPVPSSEAKLVYFVVLGATTVVALISIVAGLTAQDERAESISAIKADFDKHILTSFEDTDAHDSTSPKRV